MLESEKYKLSTYEVMEVIKQTDTSVVEIVKNTVDEKKYIKKTYPSDKRVVFNALAKIDHSSIPKICEIFFGTDTIVIEEYIDGKTIQELIEENHSFTKKEIQYIFSSLIEGVDILHSNNIIHRDIKPGNIMVKENGLAVLIDFSIARIYSNKRAEDTELLGTIGYAAPEQFGFSQTDFRSDIYALGMTIKELASKKNMPKQLVNIINRCCEFDPSKRFQTIPQLKRNLQSQKYIRNIFLTVMMFAFFVSTVLFFLNPRKNILESKSYIEKSVETEADVSNTNSLSPVQDEVSDIQESESRENTNQNNDVDEKKITPVEIQQPTQKPEIIDKSKDSQLIYSPTSTRIVDTSQAASGVPCLQLTENATYNVHIDISGELKDILVSATKDSNGFRITIDKNATYYCVKDTSLSNADYPNGEIFAEVLFYDLNNDGAVEIIPVLCDAVSAKWADGETVLLKNYSLGWCIYNDGESFKLANGRMLADMEGFKIYSSSPSCVWTDFPMYYKLENGSIVKKS